MLSRSSRLLVSGLKPHIAKDRVASREPLRVVAAQARSYYSEAAEFGEFSEVVAGASVVCGRVIGMNGGLACTLHRTSSVSGS